MGGETTQTEAEVLKHQAGLKAQIWLEEWHVSSGLRGFAPSREPVTLREGPRRREEAMIVFNP
jgi:hypothetical protein